MGHTIFRDIGGIGIDVWQSKSGSIFDNFFISTSLEEARLFAKRTWHPRRA